MNIFKKYSINIFNNTKIVYCNKNNILIAIGTLNTNSLKLELKLNIIKTPLLIHVTNVSVNKISNNKKKLLKALRNTTIILIKQLLIDTSYIIYKKLNLIGVGYKVFSLNNTEIPKILRFKLGFSHQIYFKIPDNFNFFCFKKQTKLYIYGPSCQKTSQTVSIIQSLKLPEPYKGKGILQNNEKINLKEGKKHK